MREPELFERDQDWIDWARENKKRADRLLAAAKAILEPIGPDYRNEGKKRQLELQRAAADYEDTRG